MKIEHWQDGKLVATEELQDEPAKEDLHPDLQLVLTKTTPTVAELAKAVRVLITNNT